MLRRFLTWVFLLALCGAPVSLFAGFAGTGIPVGATGGGAGCTIQSISLSNLTFSYGVANATVGTASSTLTGSCGADSWSVSGTDAAKFAFTGSTLKTNGTLTSGDCSGGGATCSINIVDTISGATGSPKTQAETLTGSTGTLLVARTATNYNTSSTPSTFYTSIGQGFASGAIPSGSHPEVRLSDGVTVVSDQQCQNTVTWGDGSLKFAQLTWKHPNTITASGSDTVKIYAASGACPTTSSIALSTAAGTNNPNHDYRMEITISGTTYTLSLNNEVGANARVKQIRAGPTMAGWKVWGAFRNGTTIGSTDQGSLWGIFYVYVYDDNSIVVWPQAFNARGLNSTAQDYTVSTVAFKDYKLGTPTIVSYSSLVFAAGTTWPLPADNQGNPYYTGTSTYKTVWAFPTLTFGDSTTTGFYDAMLLWWHYSTGGPSGSRANTPLSAGGYTWVPNDFSYVQSFNGGVTGSSWDVPGGSDWIGPITEDDAAFYLLGTYNSMVSSRIVTLETASNPYFYMDIATGYPLNLTSASQTGLSPADGSAICWHQNGGGGSTITITTGGADGRANSTHSPSVAYMQYLYSGDEWWLEWLQDAVVGTLGNGNPAFRNDVFPTGTPIAAEAQYAGDGGNQSRGNAWYTRNLGNAAWVTPGSSPMKAYLNTLLADQINGLNLAVPSAGVSPLGIMDLGDTLGSGNMWSAFEHDWLASSLAMEIRRGNLTTSDTVIARHLVLAVYGRFNNACAYNSTWYRTGLGDGADASGGSFGYATAWANVYVGNNTAIPPNLAQPITTNCLGSGLSQGYGLGAGAGNDYGEIAQVGSNTGQIAGITGASTVVTYLGATEAACSSCTEAWWGSYPHKRIRVPQ